MARKISFEVAGEEEQPTTTPVDTGSRAPSLSGMARSLHAAAAASIREIDVNSIEGSAYKDRLEFDEDEITDLAASIAAQGQLIPILVSPLPQGRFRIVYGRRRLEALRRLGLPARALVRDLNEDQAIIAQGQENSFRKDLSWIEKAAFARQLLEDGRSDELVCDALNIDQKARRSGDKLTGLSRMKQVTTRLALALIEAVGPAPKVGRDRWYDLSLTLERKGFPPGNQADLTQVIEAQKIAGLASDARFDMLEEAVAKLGKTPALRAASQEPVNHDLPTFGQVKVTARTATITVNAKEAADLHDWISRNPAAALQALREAQQQSR